MWQMTATFLLYVIINIKGLTIHAQESTLYNSGLKKSYTVSISLHKCKCQLTVHDAVAEFENNEDV